MRYLSLFSGIEAASVACKGMDWQAVAFSEIADFPSAVLKYHYPDVLNLGDVKNINGAEYHGAVDLIVGGSLCQDFSIAGNRAGLHGERSGLAREYLRIITEIQPKWIIWENVPGAFTTNNGRDFSRIIMELAKFGYGLAWRVMDAQYFGVPQRRRRIFIVGYFGNWRPPTAVLFEQKSLSGNYKKSKGKQCDTSGNIGAGSFPAMLENVCSTLLANAGTKQFIGNQEAFSDKYFVFDFKYGGKIRTYNNCNTLSARMGTGGNNVPITFCSQSYSEIKKSHVGATLRAIGGMYDGGSENYVLQNLNVRKLTPVECERLQGFPDNYTDIPYKGKQHSPLSKRYEVIGNSMAVPVVKWIFNKMNIVENLLNKKMPTK